MGALEKSFDQSFYSLGCFSRESNGEFGEYKHLYCGPYHKLKADSVILAFVHAGTGPGSLFRNLGAWYQVKDNKGRIVLSIHVTAQGIEALNNKIQEMLDSDRRKQLREWAETPENADYCHKAKIVLSGDVQHVINHGLIHRITEGEYVFDSSNLLYLLETEKIK